MFIKFLGSGSAFVLGKENYQSNILISKEVKNIEREIVTKHLLYDAGTTIPEALNYFDMTPQDLDIVYISHLHADHAGGIEYLAFKTYFEQFPFGQKKINLVCHKSILFNGWDNTWKGGLQSIQGMTNSLESYFWTHYLESNDEFDFHGTLMKPIQTVHVVDDRMINPIYGLMFDHEKETVFITGDSQFAPNQMLTYFHMADIIFHDCEFAEYPNSVHAQFHQLKTLSEDTKKKMWLYHYSLGDKHIWELEQEVLAAGFAGIVRKGQEFKIGKENV